jgi:hypothetical protein
MMNKAGNRRRILGGTLAALAVTGGAFAAAAPTAGAAPVRTDPGAAPMATCGYADDHSISGAKAYWQLSCSGGNVTVSGWVEDTSSNGRCAKVKAQFHRSGDWKFSEAACPKGDRESFSWTQPGSGANVYLYEYDV